MTEEIVKPVSSEIMIQSSTNIVQISDNQTDLKLPAKSIVSDNKKQTHLGDLNSSMDPSISQSSTDMEENQHAQSYYNQKSGNNHQFQGQDQNCNSQRYAKCLKKRERNFYYTNQNKSRKRFFP